MGRVALGSGTSQLKWIASVLKEGGKAAAKGAWYVRCIAEVLGELMYRGAGDFADVKWEDLGETMVTTGRGWLLGLGLIVIPKLPEPLKLSVPMQRSLARRPRGKTRQN